MTDLAPGYIETSADVGFRRGTRDIIEAAGEDTAMFLQGQLSQDVAAMDVGTSRYSLLLAPQGKIDAWIRVSRVGDSRFLLDVDAGWADAVITRLLRFRLRTKCDLTQLSWESLSVRGPNAPVAEIAGSELTTEVEWAGVPGLDAFGPQLSVPEGMVELSEAAWTALRIEAGEPAMGTEMDESTIPAAAGIVDRSVSFTKGCYTGQELVARIDSRGGNVPRRLVGVTAETPLQAGEDLERDGKSVGGITSASWSPRLDRHVALAYVARSVSDDDVAANATLDRANGGSASLHPLPFG